MANFHIGQITNTTFNDQSAVIRNIEVGSASEQIDFKRIENELAEIKKQLPENSLDYQTVQQMESAAKKRDWKSLSNIVIGLAGQFSVAALANLTGAYLSSLLKL